MKNYFKRLLLALFNRPYCECNYRKAGIYKREDLNPEFLKIIDDIEEKLKR